MRFCILFVASVAVGICGCGSGSSVVPVAGKVTLDGKPLANAHIAFQPIAGAKRNVGVGSYANTDAEGRFQLKTSDNDQPGAVIGQHRVEINLRQAEGDDRDPRTRPVPKVLPPRYNLQSELQFEVKSGGTSDANFDLKSQ